MGSSPAIDHKGRIMGGAPARSKWNGVRPFDSHHGGKGSFKKEGVFLIMRNGVTYIMRNGVTYIMRNGD